MARKFLFLAFAGSLSLACGDKGGGESSDSNPTGASTEDPSTDPGTTMGGTDDPAGTETGGETTGTGSTTTTATATDSDGTDTDCNFVCESDMGGPILECDVWAQDCPDGEKCMPWANDGGNSWNATKCSPVDPNPGIKGDECTTEGGVSGVDTCDKGLFCYYLDSETGIGTCIDMCTGSPENAMCDMGEVCAIANGGVLILCRPECDPILQDCDFNNVACLPAANSDKFTCIIDASGDAGAYLDPCEFLNSCDPGLFCASAAAVAGCQGANGCCTPFCDLTDPDPNSMCPGNAMGEECVPWYEMGQAPPGYDHVGGCVLPA